MMLFGIITIYYETFYGGIYIIIIMMKPQCSMLKDKHVCIRCVHLFLIVLCGDSVFWVCAFLQSFVGRCGTKEKLLKKKNTL